MSDTDDPHEPAIWPEYKRRLDAYAEALANGADAPGLLLDLADEERRRMCAVDATNAVSDSMHLTLGFSHAVGAAAAAEAERLYQAMTADDRRNIDELDAHAPGTFKIWQRIRSEGQ